MKKIISSVLFSFFLLFPASFLICQDNFDTPNPMESTDSYEENFDFNYDLDLNEAENNFFSQDPTQTQNADYTAPEAAPRTENNYTEGAQSSAPAQTDESSAAVENYVEIVNTLDAVAIKEDSLLLILSGNPEYNIFALSKPERLVIDFSNTEYAIKKGIIPVSNPFVEKVRGSQFKKDPVKVTRMVIDLKKSGIDYEVTKEDEVIILSFFKPKSRK
ncbi:AMIN domain-containing protein [Elusimicrobiota bacterium]